MEKALSKLACCFLFGARENGRKHNSGPSFSSSRQIFMSRERQREDRIIPGKLFFSWHGNWNRMKMQFSPLAWLRKQRQLRAEKEYNFAKKKSSGLSSHGAVYEKVLFLLISPFLQYPYFNDFTRIITSCRAKAVTQNKHCLNANKGC